MKRFTLLLISAAAICAAQGGFPGPGRYLIVNVRSNLALEPARGGVVQNNRNGSRGQMWNVAPAAGGQVTIQNEGNGCALTLGGTGNSVPVRCEPLRRRGNDQFWSLQPGRDGNPLIVARNGRVLDIPNSSRNSGVRVQTHNRNDGDNQRFFFQPARGGPGFGGGPGGRPGGGPGANIVTCSSDNGRRRSCAADTSRGVIISREFGRNRCVQGQTWGTDRNGIWVDRGCSADFRLGR